MSRVAKAPVVLPQGVEVKIEDRLVTVKGAKGTLQHTLNESVAISQADSKLSFASQGDAKDAVAQSGTARVLVNNMVLGVTNGFERKLTLVGVGYRAQAKGSVLDLSLGFSHPVNYQLPEGITAECPSQTEIVIKGIDKQVVGQVAAEVRAFRPPEPYKGKGVRYADEVVRTKEAKKK